MASIPASSMISSPPELRVDGHQRGRAGLEPAGVVVQLERRGIEAELLAMREPARHARREGREQLGTRVEERHPGAAQQPLEPAARVEVHVEGLHVHRHLTRRLIAVDEAEGASAMGDPGDRSGVLDGTAGEEDVARGDDRRAVVHGALVHLERHADAVGTLQQLHLHARGHLRQPLVGDGGKVERRDHDLGAPAVVQGFRHGGEGAGDVRVQRHRARRRTDHPAVRGTQLGQGAPPGVVPGGCSRAAPRGRGARRPGRATAATAPRASSCSGRWRARRSGTRRGSAPRGSGRGRAGT